MNLVDPFAQLLELDNVLKAVNASPQLAALRGWQPQLLDRRPRVQTLEQRACDDADDADLSDDGSDALGAYDAHTLAGNWDDVLVDGCDTLLKHLSAEVPVTV